MQNGGLAVGARHPHQSMRAQWYSRSLTAVIKCVSITPIAWIS